MTTQTITLKHPFEFRGERYTKFEMRRPKLRDLKMFAAENEVNAIGAYGKIIAELCEVPHEVMEDLDLADFAPLKNKVEDFLSEMASA